MLTIRTTASQQKPLRSLALLLNFFDELRRNAPVGKIALHAADGGTLL